AGHVKQRERTRHIPILFLTAVDYDPHLAFRGYQAGAVDYITKPFDPWVLRSKVAVFVDLWTTHTQLADRASEVTVLRSAIDEALELLESAAPADVARARARLAAVRGARLGTSSRPSAYPLRPPGGGGAGEGAGEAVAAQRLGVVGRVAFGWARRSPQRGDERCVHRRPGRGGAELGAVRALAVS